MSNSDRRVGSTFIWTIENISHCLLERGSSLGSPVFVMDGLCNTAWRLWLYPRGNNTDRIELEISRISDDTALKKIKVDYELSFLDFDGVTIVSLNMKNQEFDIYSHRINSFFELNKMIGASKGANEKGKRDILTIRCTMWNSEIDHLEPEIHFEHTRIHAERKLFMWNVNDSSSLQQNQRHKLRVETSKPYPFLNFELFLDRGEVVINITNVKRGPGFAATCRISVLDCIGSIVMSECGKHTFNSNSRDQEVWKFPSFINIGKLYGNKRLYLPKDVLCLRCDCLFSGVVINAGSKDVDLVAFKDYNMSALKCDKRCMNEVVNPSKSSGISNCDKQCMTEVEETKTNDENTSESMKHFASDMHCMYQEGVFCDFNLQAECKTIPVHKALLCARSPVFRSMFTIMKTNSNSMDIPDVDADTLHRMLLFIYTNRVDNNMHWAIAMKLYIVADKYAIELLKCKSSSILLLNLCSSNACHIFAHADLYKDEDLKLAALDFIVSHGSEIICTEQWKSFQESHLQLATEILSELSV